MDGRLLLHAVAGMILLWFGIRACRIFLKRHTKYNLATAVIIIALFVGTVLNFFYPGRIKAVGGTAVQIVLSAIFVTLLMLFLFSPEIGRFLKRLRSRNE